ncbi:MAG: glucokinase, partial [Verrucomicrobiaceae bacterium]|nr:glucokinase [Verrucomicrobiaceae bacterium]
MAKSKAPTDPKPKTLAKTKFWIGFDLGGTKMLATVMDADYRIVATAKKSTNGSDGPIKGKKKIVAAIKEAIEDSGYDPKCLQGIGIGCPGLVNPAKGILLSAPNLGWHNVGLRKLLQTTFKAPVAVLN